MKFFRMIFAVMTLLASGSASAADIDEMLSDAIGKFKADIKGAKIDVEKVAVYAIEPDSGGKVNISMVQDQVESALLETGRFKVINRKALKALLEEQALSLTGVVDETQMVKAGKLIGAQGFFYGSVEVQKNKLILNIKLIEVESSAVAYSKKFTGESRSFSRIGIHWGYVSSAMGLHYSADMGGVVPPKEIDNPLTDVGMGGAASGGLTYKQGFQAFKYAMLGIDLGFASLMPQGTNSAKSDNVAGGNAKIIIQDAAIYSAKLKIYLSSKEVIGWEYDWVNPYAGASFASYNMTIRMGRNYEEKDIENSMFVISPLVGFEVNATQSLSIFGEGVFNLSEVKSSDGELIYGFSDGYSFTNYGFVPKGTVLTFGLKYYFNLF